MAIREIRRKTDAMKSIRIERDVIFDQDVEVRMRDGVRLMVNVFRPAADRPCTVVMSVTPYGKDLVPDWIHMTLMRLTGVRFGHLACSKWTGFEAPDPHDHFHAALPRREGWTVNGD